MSSNPQQDFADLQRQINEINSQRTQLLQSLQFQGAMENEIISNTRQAAELAAMTQNGDDAEENLEKYKGWVNRTFTQQRQRVNRSIRQHEINDGGLERAAKLVGEKLKNAAEEVIDAFDPKHLAETTAQQGHTLLTMVAASTIATNFGKIEGLFHKVSDFFGSGTLKDTLGYIAGDEGKNGILASIAKIVRSPIEYLVEWIKGELTLRVKMMDTVKMPTYNSDTKDLGTLQPFGNMLTSLSNFLRDVVSALGDKLKILIDPRSSITYQANEKISNLAAETREKKRNIDAKTKDWNERGLLYTKDGQRNYGRFIPSVFLTPLGGLDGTHGSTLAASRELFGIIQEALTGNRADTASLVDVFNKLWVIAERNGSVLVEDCFLDSLAGGQELKYDPVLVHVLRRKFRVDVAIIDAILPINLRDKKVIYLTDEEWKGLNKDCKKDFEEICQVTVYRLTLDDLRYIANGQFGINNFDSSNNEEFIIAASNWLEHNKGGEGSDKEAELVARYTQEGMVDKATQAYSESREEYERVKEEIINKIKDITNGEAIELPEPPSPPSQGQVVEIHEGSFGGGHSGENEGNAPKPEPKPEPGPVPAPAFLTPSNPGGPYPIERCKNPKTNTVTGKTGNLAYRNNNPGNIIYVGEDNLYPGEVSKTTLEQRGNNSQIKNGFKIFNTLQAGFEGIFYNLEKGSHYFASKNNTVKGIIETWCPNDDAYIQNVANALGVSKDTPLSIDDRNAMVTLAKAIYKQEDSLGFSVLDPKIVEDAYDHYMATNHPKGDPGNITMESLNQTPFLVDMKNITSPNIQVPLKVSETKSEEDKKSITQLADNIASSIKTNLTNKDKSNKIGQIEMEAEINSQKAVIEAIKTCIIEEVGNKIDTTNLLLK